jgi:hypothetical protein
MEEMIERLSAVYGFIFQQVSKKQQWGGRDSVLVLFGVGYMVWFPFNAY